LDFVFHSSTCPTDPMSAYVNCAQNAIADLVEVAANQKGPTIVNMSLGLYYFSRSSYNRLLEEKGCDNSPKINLESLKRIARAVRDAPPDKIFVASAGNSGMSGALGFPACLERVYSVAAIKREKQYDPQGLRLASYSNYSLRGRSYAEPIGGVMKSTEFSGYEIEGTSFSSPLLAAIFANMVAMCYHEPSKLNPSYMTREGVGVPTIWSAEC
jgi:subtilisin family serine protease